MVCNKCLMLGAYKLAFVIASYACAIKGFQFRKIHWPFWKVLSLRLHFNAKKQMPLQLLEASSLVKLDTAPFLHCVEETCTSLLIIYSKARFQFMAATQEDHPGRRNIWLKHSVDLDAQTVERHSKLTNVEREGHSCWGSHWDWLASACLRAFSSLWVFWLTDQKMFREIYCTA